MNDDLKYLEEILCTEDKMELFDRHFFWLYPFTNENIKAYYSNINFKNKEVLCVTSSGDHALNAIISGAKNVTCFDINPLAKYYSELKIAAIKALSLEEFILFFYNKNWSSIKYFLNKQTYYKVRENLNGKYKDFWDYFFYKYNKKQIFDSFLFTDDYLSLKALLEVNSYLNEKSYNKLKELLKNKKIDYYDISLKDLNTINKKYDVVILSNISAFLDYVYEKDKLKNLKESINSVSKENARVVVNYFYDNLLYGDDEQIIYDKKLVSEYFNKNDYEYKTFESSHMIAHGKILRLLINKYDQVLISKDKK